MANNFTIANGANTPLNQRTGTVPDVSGALKDWFQLMTFSPVTKMTTAFQVIETGAPVSFWGHVVPKKKNLLMLEEGQRRWTWLTLYAEPALTLDVDDVVILNSTQTRVMDRDDFSLFGYVTYTIIQDFTGAGPA